MRKLLVIVLFVLAFTTSVTSSKSEVSYEIYYKEATQDLIQIINHIEETYRDVTKDVDKDDVDVMIRLCLEEFKTNSTVSVEFESNRIKLYMCNEDEAIFTYKGYLQDSCKNNIEKTSWLNVWGI